MKKIASIEERDTFIGQLCADPNTDWDQVAKDVADSANERSVDIFDMEIMALALYMLSAIQYLRLTALGAVIRGDKSDFMCLLLQHADQLTPPEQVRAALAEIVKESDNA